MAPISVKAPGRICLFGDHQDYLGLPIIACAIDRYIKITVSPNHSDQFNIKMPDLGEERVLRFREPALPAGRSVNNPKKGDHLAACLKVVSNYGCIPNQGYSITINGTIPINAGLSSSSALVVAWVQWLLSTFGCNQEITPELVAKLAYQAEVVEQNSPGGKMDQYTSALGHILYLETDEKSHFEHLNTTLDGLIIGVSGIPKDTIGLLGDLRGNALKAVDLVTSKNPQFYLQTATMDDYEINKKWVPENLQRFLNAAIKNHRITKEALDCFRESVLNPIKIGALLYAHHAVLRDQLQITVPRIDAMIEAALEAGAYGAKIVGSGGGGCICALAPKDKEDQIKQAILHAGAIEAHSVSVSKGVHIL